MSSALDEARKRMEKARAADAAAESARDEYFFEHPYGGPQSEALLEAHISAYAERQRALLALRRALEPTP
jgi:hypothetical protein